MDRMKSTVNANRLDRVSQFMEQYVSGDISPGMLSLVSHQGRIIYLGTKGYADICVQSPIREDTIFRIHSMTKPITSVALMSLMEQGKFHLDEAAHRWISGLRNLKVYASNEKLQPLDSKITIRQLLTHTAGFSYGFHPDAHPVDKIYDQTWRSLKHNESLEYMMKIMLDIPLIAQPGTLWNYSIATDICGYLIELMSDMPFGDYLDKTIFTPLGMVDTAFEVPPKKQDRFAKLYGYSTNNPLVETTLKGDSPYLTERETDAVTLQCGGNGLVSTAKDYWHFAQMMLNLGELEGTRVISRKTVEWMTTNHLNQALLPLSYNGIVPQQLTAYGFGLGYCINLDPVKAGTLGSLGDFGWGGMAGTYCWCDPKEQLIGILMQQYAPESYHTSRRDFRNSVYQAIL